jgi:hypothetical protein
MKLSILAATAAVQSMANHELAEGDRVKLTERALKGHKKQGQVNWAIRRGIIIALTKNGRAYVLWDGRKSYELVALASIEKER